MSEHERIDQRYYQMIREQVGEHIAPLLLYTYRHFHFADLPLSGKRILDIGGGTGKHSFYAAAAGAREVVCLEPEAAGSSEGVIQEFMKQKSFLGYENVILLDKKIEEFSSDEPFDILFSCASINHIDEEACIVLRKEQWAKEKYIYIFNHLKSLVVKGGYLIIIDASTPCFYSLLGIKNPFAPTIEWHKHQPPSVWAKIAAEVGFKHLHTRWASPARLGSLGRVLLGNAFANFFWRNLFCLVLQLD